MAKTAKTEKNARAQVIKEQQAALKRRERRNQLLVWGTLTLILASIVVAAMVVLSNAAEEKEQLEAAVDQPIEGVVVEPDQIADHIEALPEVSPDPVTGTVLPPMGGVHDPAWQNCGIYTEPIRSANAVHSLEHGAVWVAYHPDLVAEDVQTLTTKLTNRPYTILSPVPDLASPVVLTAWGIQLELDDPDDERFDVFLAKYVQGPQTPEPGATCSGAVGVPQ